MRPQDLLDRYGSALEIAIAWVRGEEIPPNCFESVADIIPKDSMLWQVADKVVGQGMSKLKALKEVRNEEDAKNGWDVVPSGPPAPVPAGKPTMGQKPTIIQKNPKRKMKL